MNLLRWLLLLVLLPGMLVPTGTSWGVCLCPGASEAAARPACESMPCCSAKLDEARSHASKVTAPGCSDCVTVSTPRSETGQSHTPDRELGAAPVLAQAIPGAFILVRPSASWVRASAVPRTTGPPGRSRSLPLLI